jgi:hypothetical protein
MPMPNIIENIFCGRISNDLKDTASKLTDAQIEAAHNEQLYEGASKDKGILLDQLTSCKKNIADQYKSAQNDINRLIEEKAALQSQITSLTAQAQKKSLYGKPCPAMFQEVAANKVMMGSRIIKTAQETVEVLYPSPPSIYFPCPYFEDALNATDCNRPRPDLTPIEICTKIANYYQTRMHYLTDQQQFGRPDNWTTAPDTRALGKDDCESLSALIASTCLLYEVKFGAFQDYTIATAAGHLIIGGEPLGHDFVILQHNTSASLNDSYVIEATLSYAATPKTYAEAKASYWMDWGIIGFVRDSHPEGSYWMQPQFSWWGTGAEKAKPSIVKKLKVKLHLEKDEKQKKREEIHKIWANRRRA